MMIHAVSRIAVNFFIFALSLALLFVFLELTYRTAQYFRWGPKAEREVTLDDPELGWLNNPTYDTQFKVNDCGERVVLQASGHKHLLKTPIYEGGKKILFLGDSFTHAVSVSTGKAYYDIFEALNPSEFSVYAAGIGSYGTYSKYVLLTKIYDQIQPDIVVWQLAGNDLRENVFSKDMIRLGPYRRAYLDPETGQAEIKTRYSPFLRASDGLRSVIVRLKRLDLEHPFGFKKFLIWLNDFFYPPRFTKAEEQEMGRQVMRMVLKNAANRYRETQFIGFSADPRLSSVYEAAFQEIGALYLPHFSLAVSSEPKTNCPPLDGHWNHKGHRIAGEALSEMINELITQ